MSISSIDVYPSNGVSAFFITTYFNLENKMNIVYKANNRSISQTIELVDIFRQLDNISIIISDSIFFIENIFIISVKNLIKSTREAFLKTKLLVKLWEEATEIAHNSIPIMNNSDFNIFTYIDAMYIKAKINVVFEITNRAFSKGKELIKDFNKITNLYIMINDFAYYKKYNFIKELNIIAEASCNAEVIIIDFVKSWKKTIDILDSIVESADIAYEYEWEVHFNNKNNILFNNIKS